MMKFINVHGTWIYVDGHFVQRTVKGLVRNFFRDNSTGKEYPERWVKDYLSECEKADFAAQWNKTYQENCEKQILIHPEDKEILSCYKPMTFEEIVELHIEKGV